MTLSISLSMFAAMLLTPLIITVWSQTFPPALPGEPEHQETLRARNSWIDSIATMFMFVGLFLPIILFRHNFNAVGIWAIGLMFGLMVSMHFLWVCVATIPFGGMNRFNEFWRFYELRWGYCNERNSRRLYSNFIDRVILCGKNMGLNWRCEERCAIELNRVSDHQH